MLAPRSPISGRRASFFSLPFLVRGGLLLFTLSLPPLAALPGCATPSRSRSSEPRPWPREDAPPRVSATPAMSATPAPAAPELPSHFIHVDGGKLNTCALGDNGAVACWGSEQYGLFRPESSQNRHTVPTLVPQLSGVVELSVATHHACARTREGHVTCWGYRVAFGLQPTRVKDADGAKGITAGARDCAWFEDGTARCWQYRDGLKMVEVPGLTEVVMIASGGTSNCALKRDGSVGCWGYFNNLGQLGDGTREPKESLTPVAGLRDAVAIVAGGNHTCALRTGGAVSCWGLNVYGQLGNGQSGRSPKEMLHSPIPVAVRGITDAVELAAGGGHTCARLKNGSVQCWGENRFGQLGQPLEPNAPSTAVALHRPSPAPVRDLTGAVAIAAGDDHTCARLASGELRCWGLNSDGQLGIGTELVRPRPAPVVGITDAVEIGAGSGYSCARLKDGTVRCWGGFEPDLDPDVNGFRKDEPLGSDPIKIRGITNAEQIAIARVHGCARTSAGAVQCWGRSGAGQLGDGLRLSQLRLDAVVARNTGRAAYIAAGGFTLCARRLDGSVVCWGGVNGRVAGNELTLNPALVPGFQGAAQIVAGSSHSCALVAGGAVRCWGYNDVDQLGLGAASHKTYDVMDVPGLAGALEIGAGESHTCARMSDGRVVCWGEHRFGSPSRSPRQGKAPLGLAQIDGLGDVVEIACGGYHTCARLQDGSVKCWGENVNGQLGDGTIVSRGQPVAVHGLTDAVEVATGADHTCARRAGGSVTCWGNGVQGQLGDGAVLYSWRPMPVQPARAWR